MAAQEPKRLEKNQVLFREGESAPSFYILLSGKLAIFRRRKFVKSVGGRGIFIGEVANLLGQNRSATVITLQPATLVEIPNRADKIFLHHAEIGMKLIESLRHRVSETYDRAEKLWEEVMKTITEIVVYEASTKSAARKTLSFGEMEEEKTSVRKAVVSEMQSEDFDFSKLRELLSRLDISAEYDRNIREKFPRFRQVNLKQMKDLWKKRMPDDTPGKLHHCMDLAAGLEELTDFLTSFGTQDEDTGLEEIEMLESSVDLPRRAAILKSVSQSVLTPKEGIEKMKVINRDMDIEVEEADRHQQRTGRIFFLTDFAKKIGIENPYLELLRKEFWDACLKN